MEIATGGTVRKHIVTCSAGTVGFLTGILIGTPALFINGHRTWQDIRANFTFIQNYNVTPSFQAESTGRKIYISLSNNIPLVFSSLGWIISILALTGLILATIKLISVMKASQRQGQEDTRWFSLIVSISAFPFLALIISLIGKPQVQPFHFSYLQAPLILAAIFALTTLWDQPHRFYRIIAVILLAMAFLEFGGKDEKDLFFWVRGDNVHWENRYAAMLLRDPELHAEARAPIKTISLEPGNHTIFRNRSTTVSFPHADFWNSLQIAPVPDVPMEVDHDWIFPNGPVFPRNDRMVRIRRDSTLSRQVVFFSEPAPH